jgi:hypothetical protein
MGHNVTATATTHAPEPFSVDDYARLFRLTGFFSDAVLVRDSETRGQFDLGRRVCTVSLHDAVAQHLREALASS